MHNGKYVDTLQQTLEVDDGEDESRGFEEVTSEENRVLEIHVREGNEINGDEDD
ncbi:hypothetical protein KI387_001486, partial [Taxus chinensis]